MYTEIKPGREWNDTNGNPIHAHGGSILYHEGTYYWYGENKAYTDLEKGIWHYIVVQLSRHKFNIFIMNRYM